MLRAAEVSDYFFAKDPDRKVFNMLLMERNKRHFYEGNAKMNKFLHMAQNLHIAKSGVPLFSDDMYAYDNGAVVVDVMNSYPIMQKKHHSAPDFGCETNDFLDRVFHMLKNCDIDELIALSHEDEEWAEKSRNWRKAEQKMHSMSRADEYKKQYADGLAVLYRMDTGEDA